MFHQNALGVYMSFIHSVCILADHESPKFPNGCPANQQLFAGPLESPVTVTWSDPDTSDNSGQSVTLSSDVRKGSTLGPGFYVIRITAADPMGNKASCNFVVTVGGIEKIGVFFCFVFITDQLYLLLLSLQLHYHQ